jgi:hypothetical protein
LLSAEPTRQLPGNRAEAGAVALRSLPPAGHGDRHAVSPRLPGEVGRTRSTRAIHRCGRCRRRRRSRRESGARGANAPNPSGHPRSKGWQINASHQLIPATRGRFYVFRPFERPGTYTTSGNVTIGLGVDGAGRVGTAASSHSGVDSAAIDGDVCRTAADCRGPGRHPIKSRSSGCRWPDARRERPVGPTRRGWDRPRPPPWHCRRLVPVR